MFFSKSIAYRILKDEKEKEAQTDPDMPEWKIEESKKPDSSNIIIEVSDELKKSIISEDSYNDEADKMMMALNNNEETFTHSRQATINIANDDDARESLYLLQEKKNVKKAPLKFEEDMTNRFISILGKSGKNDKNDKNDKNYKNDKNGKSGKNDKSGNSGKKRPLSYNAPFRPVSNLWEEMTELACSCIFKIYLRANEDKMIDSFYTSL